MQMFQFCLHTAFIRNEFLAFDKPVLDGACKDIGCKNFPKHFRCELFFGEVPGLNTEEEYHERYAALLNFQDSPLHSEELTTPDVASAESTGAYSSATEGVGAARSTALTAPVAIENISIRDSPPLPRHIPHHRKR